MKKILFALSLISICIFIFSKITSKVTQNIDTYIYQLPYQQGTSHKVVQGYGGLFSHKNTAALDFTMPVGTPIYAAREGEIYSYKDDGTKGGWLSSYKKEANYIIIKHSDGSFGCYWHLQYKGVVTKKGKVAKGQLIGYSGNTGFTLQPHLHFSVKKALNYEMNSFVRTKFYTDNGVEFLESGNKYKW